MMSRGEALNLRRSLIGWRFFNGAWPLGKGRGVDRVGCLEGDGRSPVSLLSAHVSVLGRWVQPRMKRLILYEVVVLVLGATK
jgi:hypothetical protein